MSEHDDFGRNGLHRDGGDDGFERDLRKTLDDLGRAPAPEQMIARVRTIPRAEPRPRVGFAHRSPFAALAGLAAAAAVAGIVVGGLLLRPITGPAATATPSPAVSGIAQLSPSAPASTPPSSESPSGSPSGSPAPSSTSSATLSPTPGPTPTGPSQVVVGGPVPAGFQPFSVTFASSTEGWVLGTYSCGQPTCTLVVHTTDAGQTWTVRGMPSVAAAPPPPGEAAAPVQSIRFADSQHGWMYGSELWATSDGGATWTQTSISGFSGGRYLALEVARGIVHAVGLGQNGFAIATSQVGSGSWHLAPLSLPSGAGPVPQLQLVLSGGAGWVVQNDRVVTNGARYANGWASWTPPCASSNGPAYLAASSSANVLAACDVGLWSTPQGIHLYVSSDGGGSFSQVGQPLPLQSVVGVATPGPATIVAAGSTQSSTSELVASFDGGQHWATVLTTSAAGVADLGFTTTSRGVVVEYSTNGSSQLYMTRDGGHTWTPVTF